MVEADILHKNLQAVSTVVAAAPSGADDALPVRRLVAGFPEAIPFHEALQPLEAMATASLPVDVDAVDHLAQEVAGQVRNPYPRKDDEAGVAGDAAEPLRTFVEATSRRLVTRGAPSCASTEKQACRIMPGGVAGQKTHVLAHHPEPEVVVPVIYPDRAARLPGPSGCP